GRPRVVGTPAVCARLKSGDFPTRLRAPSVKIVAKERRFDVLTKLPRRLMTAESYQPDAVCFQRPPLPVKPGPGDHEVYVLRIALSRVTKNLPRSPRIFLIPKARDIQQRNSCRV